MPPAGTPRPIRPGPISPPLREVTDPRHRLDVATYRLIEQCFRSQIEPAIERSTGRRLPLWDSGIGTVIDQFIRENMPSSPIGPLEIAQAIGLLKGGKR